MSAKAWSKDRENSIIVSSGNDGRQGSLSSRKAEALDSDDHAAERHGLVVLGDVDLAPRKHCWIEREVGAAASDGHRHGIVLEEAAVDGRAPWLGWGLKGLSLLARPQLHVGATDLTPPRRRRTAQSLEHRVYQRGQAQIKLVGSLMRNRLKMRRDGVRAWLLYDAATRADIGGIQYEHAPDGNHYRPWLLIDGARRNLGSPLPQLAMAARAVEEAWS